MRASVILSTYNNPTALEKSFWGFRYQRYRDFEILIADDGSSSKTREVIAAATEQLSCPVIHLWHEDIGFRKSEILNKAISQARAEYLIFTDGDCIPRDDFVLSHLSCARPNYYISGGSHIDLPVQIHRHLSQQDIATQRAFHPAWLAEQGMRVGKFRWRLIRNKPLARTLDALTPRPGVFLGCNGSAWKKDILAVNGFDATSTYGSDDKELGARLTNSGVKSRRLKHSLICLHQSHEKSYPAEQIRRNKVKLKRIKTERVTWIDSGIQLSKTA